MKRFVTGRCSDARKCPPNRSADSAVDAVRRWEGGPGGRSNDARARRARLAPDARARVVLAELGQVLVDGPLGGRVAFAGAGEHGRAQPVPAASEASRP